MSYYQNIGDLPGPKGLQKNGFRRCSTVLKDAKGVCVMLEPQTDDPTIYEGMTSRSLPYSLNALNIVVNSQEGPPVTANKKLVATITPAFADEAAKFPGNPKSPFRWEASAGVWFSSLANRSFSAAPIFNSGVTTDHIVTQNILRPTVVPFAAGNYRMTNDFSTRWKTNLYWTGAIGINPNTVSADFATGLSFSWRALMVSGLCHFGHDTKLDQGFTVGESLGPSFSGTVPTKTYWTESFAIGISVRVPALTGR